MSTNNATRDTHLDAGHLSQLEPHEFFIHVGTLGRWLALAIGSWGACFRHTAEAS